MATYTIRQGAHYHRVPPLSTLPWVGKQAMARYVTFDASCAYDFAAYNAEDVNKLFGLSFGFGGVHHNSARFGWRWSKSAQCIELLAYVYTAGVKQWDVQLRFPVVAQVPLGRRVRCYIDLEDGADGPAYRFTAVLDGSYGADCLVPAPAGLAHFGLTHGLYFGGALAAPQPITVRIDQV